MAADSWRRCDHRPFGDAARLHHRVALLDWHGRDHFEWRDDRRGQHRRSRNAHHRAHADSCGQPGDGLAGKSEAHADGDRSSVDRCLRTTLRRLHEYLSRGTHRVSEGAAKKEEKPRKFQAIRGTRDLLPPETALWNRVEQTAHEVFATFGFGEIRLPIFESTELFARSIGAETDVVSKEMYTFDGSAEFYARFREIKMVGEGAGRRGTLVEMLPEEMISLRPEATASVCRAYIEHGMQQLPQPVKLYYMGPMFRRERPQKGRYRQFYQIGAEVLGGSDAPAIDAEVIEMVMTFFDRLELQGVQLDINSIGCRECRPKYVELLRAELLRAKDKLGPDSQRRIETNPLRVLDSKLESEQSIIAKLPRIGDHLCNDCADHYDEVKRQLA